MRLPLIIFVLLGCIPSIYGQCMDPNSTVVSAPVYLATDKSGFDANSNLQVAFEWDPTNTRIVTDVSLDGDSNCSYYGILSNWTYFLDSTSSCNNGIQATFDWKNLYYSCPDSFTTIVLPTLQKILLSFTITIQENVSTPTGPVVRTITNQVPFEIDLPTTATLSFGPFYIVPQNVGVRIIARLAGSLANFDSVGFAQAVANFTQISPYRVVLVESSKRDFNSEFLIQPGPDGEPTADAATQTFQAGVNDGTFATQTGYPVSSLLIQDYSIQGVITNYASTNSSLYQIHFRTFVANFPSPAGITPDAISFSDTVNSIQIVETSNTVSGNYYVQDWDIFIVPGASCYVRGTVSVNFNFTGANPSTVTVAQFSIDSTSTCPSVINPTTLIGTIYAYTDISLATKATSFRQSDTIYFQAKITNNKLPILDDGLTITQIDFQLGNNPVQTLVADGSSNFTDLGYGTLSAGSAATAWMTVAPDAFPVADQYSIFSFYFYLDVAYENRKRDQPLTQAIVATRLVFQQQQASSVATPATSQKAQTPVPVDYSAGSRVMTSVVAGFAVLLLLL